MPILNAQYKHSACTVHAQCKHSASICAVHEKVAEAIKNTKLLLSIFDTMEDDYFN